MDPIIQRRAPGQALQEERRRPPSTTSASTSGAGELFAFLGPNGAGKTTTISILTTTLAKTSGTVDDRRPRPRPRREGRPAQHRDHLPEPEPRPAPVGGGEHPPARRALRPLRLPAVLPADAGRVPPAGRAPGRVVGLERRAVQAAEDVLGRHEAQARDHPQPDAPAAGPVPRRADVGSRPGQPPSLWEYLRDVRNADGTTIFLTTHYLEEAEEADRVCVIDHGRIAMIGTPDEMKRELLERSIVLDAVDRAALLAELARPRPRARPSTRPASSASPTTAPPPSDHRPDPDAAERPARPRTQPRGGLRRAPRQLDEEAGMSANDATGGAADQAAGRIRSGDAAARPTPRSRSPGARSCARSRARSRSRSP